MGSEVPGIGSLRARARGEERAYIKRFFTTGDGKCANTKYSLTEGCFDLLGCLLVLCPAERHTAEDVLKHGWFSEKPTPEWHAWHWALASADIPRGDEMRRGPTDAEKNARDLLKELRAHDDEAKKARDHEVAAAKAKAREAYERRQNEAKERHLAAAAAAAKKEAAKSQIAAATQKAVHAASGG